MSHKNLFSLIKDQKGELKLHSRALFFKFRSLNFPLFQERGYFWNMVSLMKKFGRILLNLSDQFEGSHTPPYVPSTPRPFEKVL